MIRALAVLVRSLSSVVVSSNKLLVPRYIEVAVGVICQGESILIAKRQSHQAQAGLWEFPGGKLEVGETAEQALARELQEELAIEVQDCVSLIDVWHDYIDYEVLLRVFRVEDFLGTPCSRESQPIAWVSRTQLNQYQFPEANQAIIAAINVDFHCGVAVV